MQLRYRNKCCDVFMVVETMLAKIKAEGSPTNFEMWDLNHRLKTNENKPLESKIGIKSFETIIWFMYTLVTIVNVYLSPLISFFFFFFPVCWLISETKNCLLLHSMLRIHHTDRSYWRKSRKSKRSKSNYHKTCGSTRCVLCFIGNYLFFIQQRAQSNQDFQWKSLKSLHWSIANK